MGFSLTSPAPEKCDPTAKNRVWGFFGEAPETSRPDRPQSLQPRREKHPTTTKVASGRTYWPSRDPIGERGGINLYGMVGNDSVNGWDYLGLNEEKRCCCGTRTRSNGEVVGRGMNPKEKCCLNGQTIEGSDKCEIRIFVGHCTTPGVEGFNPLDRAYQDIEKYYKEGQPRGGLLKIGLITCKAKNENQKLNTEFQYPNEKRTNQFLSPLWEGDGENTGNFLPAFTAEMAAAKKQAKEECKSVRNCCNKVTITIIPVGKDILDLMNTKAWKKHQFKLKETVVCPKDCNSRGGSLL